MGNRAVVFMSNAGLKVFGAESRIDSVQDPEADSSSAGESGADSAGDGSDGASGNVSGDSPDSSIPKYRVVDGRVVADQAYYRDEGLGEMSLADGIVEIGQFAFSRSALTDIVFPQSLEQIDYGAFYHCAQLRDVTLPESVMCEWGRGYGCRRRFSGVWRRVGGLPGGCFGGGGTEGRACHSRRGVQGS